MSDTAVQPAAAVDQWLTSFDEALTAGDPAAAAELFLEDSYWRDLVAFTWNLKTVEGRDGVEDLLKETLARTQPGRWRAAEPPTEEEGVVTAWLEFETAAGRGNGLLRLKDGRAWTLLTALYELKGHEEAKGAERRKGVGARRVPRARDVAREAPPRGRGARLRAPARRRDRRRRPGRDRARCAAAPARRADDHHRAQRAPGRLLAQALQVAVPARPGLVRPPALHQVPRELAGVLAEGQDRRLARDVHAGDGAQLLELDRGQEREVRRGRRRVDARRRARGRRRHAAPEAARARHRHVGQGQRPRDPGHGRLQGRPAPLLAAPGPGPLRGQALRGDRLQQLGPRHLRRAVGAGRRRDDGAALLHAHRALGQR